MWFLLEKRVLRWDCLSICSIFGFRSGKDCVFWMCFFWEIMGGFEFGGVNS